MKWAAPNRTWQLRPVPATSPRASLTGKKAQKRTDKSGKFVMGSSDSKGLETLSALLR
jgi:hypothetical protein